MTSNPKQSAPRGTDTALTVVWTIAILGMVALAYGLLMIADGKWR